MAAEQKQKLEQQLWNIANTLRGKMNADEFRDYILGFIFYKYLSEKMEIFANEILKQDKIRFREITPKMSEANEFLEAIKEEALEKLAEGQSTKIIVPSDMQNIATFGTVINEMIDKKK